MVRRRAPHTGVDMGGSGIRRWLVPAAIGAVLGGGVLALVAVLNDLPVTDLLLLGLGVGALMGFLGGVLYRTVDPDDPPMGPGDPYVITLPRSELRAFQREAFRGPVPTDPDRRAAAVRLLRRTLDHESVDRRSSLGYGAALLLLSVVDSFRHPWSLVIVVLVGGLLAWMLVRPGRIRQRMDVLRAAPPAGS